jgi:hypothetical protein
VTRLAIGGRGNPVRVRAYLDTSQQFPAADFVHMDIVSQGIGDPELLRGLLGVCPSGKTTRQQSDDDLVNLNVDSHGDSLFLNCLLFNPRSEWLTTVKMFW